MACWIATFNLRPFLISLLTEQVAGFYDNKTKTVNLLDWIEPEEQKPVLAHELTHALQDQKVDLTKWSEVGSDEIAKNVEQDNAHIQTDEADTARDAVAEGQAMVVFLDYTLRPTGQTLADFAGDYGQDEGDRCRTRAARRYWRGLRCCCSSRCCFPMTKGWGLRTRFC